MDGKGCIKIEERSRTGHDVRVFLPSELGLQSDAEATPPELDSIDFFTGRQYLDALLARESDRCFYCLRDVTRETCELDHVVPLANGTDNSYRNVVVSCHECNKLKQDQEAESHLRGLFRKSLLSEVEFRDRMSALEAVKAGELVPDL